MGLEVKELGLRKHWNHLTAWFTIEFYRFVVSLSLDLVAATQISACGGVADLSMWWFACFLLLPQESAAGMSSAWEIRQHDCQVASPAVVRRLTSQNQLSDLSTTEVTEPFGAVTSQIGGPKAVPSNANFARCGAKGRGRARRPSKVSCPEVRNPNLQRSELFGQGRAIFSIEKSCSICFLFQAVNGKIMKEDIRMHGNMVMVYEVPMWRCTKCLERWGDKLWQMEPVANPSENPADFPDRLRSWETPHGRTMILEISGNTAFKQSQTCHHGCDYAFVNALFLKRIL